MSSLMSTISDDLLLEILLRLPDFRSIVQCACVSKRWFSTIRSSKTYFSHKFNQYHRQKRLDNKSSSSPCPFTLLITDIHYTIGSSAFSYEFFSERSKVFGYGQEKTLEFLPWNDNKFCVLWTWFEDLLLIELCKERSLYICNPFTKEYIKLPETPTSQICRRYALVVLRGDVNTSSNIVTSIKYKVVKISVDIENPILKSIIFHDFRLSIFSSETEQWNHSTIKFQIPVNVWYHHSSVVGSNGTIYFQYGTLEIQGILALNIYSQQCRMISLPSKDPRFQNPMIIGLVRGRVRVAHSKCFDEKKQLYGLIVWELVDHEDRDDKMISWKVVQFHNRIIWKFGCDILAFHPDDEDVFFYSHFNDKIEIEIFQCRILYRNYFRIKTLCHISNVSYFFLHEWKIIRAVPLLHPWWPTRISPI
ncbi:hypothetical protein F8388_009999 [Cannabis sativa]|uniref:F-box domain-containing protein n=1 Tax=Cannabis sativa TaxID=3483 RepID=A0A7J6E7M0_CANSA|nr:hypothetical protein G4B88_025288 [Cannabis sativa]KAF4353840.1 hypothetical protein F8388_009999 [Cannabis sativa]